MTHGTGRPTRRDVVVAPAVAVATAALAFIGVLVAGADGGVAIDLPWAPSLGIRLTIRVDGLAVLYGLLAAGIGVLVFVYGWGYLPRHLGHEARPASDARRFWPWMIVFLVAMIGLASAADLILLFLFFDVTAVASYFLIGFDRHRTAARGSALMALLVTGGSAVLMLLGAAVLFAEYGTFSLAALFDVARPSPTTTAACVLIAIAALAKSAQVPLHFWLPRAMEAPTPVSAYLHSAAMVAAGVLVLGRVHPLLALDPAILDLLIVVGFGSIAIGGLLALAADELKQILAHSTISQYGYVVVLYGIGGPEGAAAAALYVLAHGLAKSALFMTAGAVTESTGVSQLSRLGGLARDLPVLAVSSGIGAASLAALPLTLGFFKDELFFTAAWSHGPLLAALAVVGAALTFAYLGRFWLGVFAGPRRLPAELLPPSLLVPIVVLAAVSLVGGVALEPFARLAAAAATVTAGQPVEVSPGYHLDARVENVMAIAAWALGALILLAGTTVRRLAAALSRVGGRIGPRQIYATLLAGLDRLSDMAHRQEVRDLRTSLLAVLVPTGILTVLGFAATPTQDAYLVGPITANDLPLVVLLALAVIAASTAARDRGRLRPVLALSVVGFSLAGVYAVMGAPDVALVAVVIETVLTLVFVSVFTRLPGTTIGRLERAAPSTHRVRDLLVGVVAGISAFAVIWAALSRPPLGSPDAAEHIARTPDAHGGDVVTVILADFRGLDTMVEITVLATAILGIATLLRRRDPA